MSLNSNNKRKFTHKHARSQKSKKRALNRVSPTSVWSTPSPSIIFPPSPEHLELSPSMLPIDSSTSNSPVQLDKSPSPVLQLSINNNNSQSNIQHPKLDNKSCNFNDWLLRKRESLKRKRHLLLDREYDLIVSYINNRNIIKHDKKLIWVRNIVAENGYTLQKIDKEDGSGKIDMLVKLKDYEVALNEQPYYIVARISTIERIIREEHTKSAHHGINITHERIEKNYVLITRDMVKAYIERCVHCVNHQAIKESAKKPVCPINAKGMLEHIVIDLIDNSNNPAGPSKEFKYIIHAVDHFSSFHYVDCLRAKSAIEVLHFFRRLCSISGTPCILHTDNGGEFRNAVIESFLSHHGVEFRHGKPYTPSTQGKVERGNCVLKRAIAKMISQSNFQKSWYDVLFEACMAINTNYSSSIKTEPYRLLYCQEPPNIQLRLDVNEEEILQSMDDEKDMIDLTLNDDLVIEPSSLSLTNNHNNTISTSKNNPNVIPGDPNQSSSSTQNVIYNAVVEEIHVPNPADIITAIYQPLLMKSPSIITSIRDNARVAYEEAIDTMIQKDTRLNKRESFHIGDVVGLLLPDEYRNPSVSNKLPALIIGYKHIEDEMYFYLGVKDYVLKGQFLPSKFIKLNASAYCTILGVDDASQLPTLTANWGKGRFGKFKYITVLEAYQKFVIYMQGKNPNLLQLTQDNDGISTAEPITSANANNIQSSQHTRVIPSNGFKNSNHIINFGEEIICNMCLVPIPVNSSYAICARCNSNIHLRDDCMCGSVQIAADDFIYCSRKCWRNTQSYEVSIISEKGHYYNVLWNTNEVSKVLKRTFNKYLDNYAIIKRWQNQKTNPQSSSTSSILVSSSSKNISPKINAQSKSVSSNISNESSNKCCVCLEELSEDQWHRCTACKNRIHGYIICPGRQKMIRNEEDERELFCSESCYSGHKNL